MTGATVLHRLARERRGAAALEFAMVAPALCLTIMGIFDMGYNIYAATMVQGAIQHAARDSTIEGSDQRQAQIDARVSRAACWIAPWTIVAAKML